MESPEPAGSVKSMSDDGDSSGARLDAIRRALVLHALAYGLVNAVLLGVNVHTGKPFWVIWPLLIWGIALIVHFLYMKTMGVEDDWVEQRTVSLRLKSYDLGHMDDINVRIKNRDKSVRPADERDP